MTLSHDDTKRLIALVLDAPFSDARDRLHQALSVKKQNEGQFYQGIIEHGCGILLTKEQWFELLSRLPNRMLWSSLDLPGLLSEEQIKRLPIVTG